MIKPKIPGENELIRATWHARNSVQHLEREYLDPRIRLRDTEADLRSDSKNQALKERVDYLKSRLKDLETRCSWISTGRLSEMPFWINYVG
jgi:polyhydroxyalkanoate synthesis regulator phasin